MATVGFKGLIGHFGDGAKTPSFLNQSFSWYWQS